MMPCSRFFHTCLFWTACPTDEAKSSEVGPSGLDYVAAGVEYSEVGQGWCRTERFGKGRFDSVKVKDEDMCQAICTAAGPMCVGVEYQLDKQICELHKEAVAQVLGNRYAKCYSKGKCWMETAR